ncbi:MAG: polyprenyl synthetase family protein [Planctomycetota bacterium]
MTRRPEQIAQDLEKAGNRIRPVLEDLFPRNRSDHLSAPFWHHMETGGKRIRPALCLLCCERLGGRDENALPFAAAVEILHNMLLIHDDLEDGDRIRRDRPAVWVKYGMENAVNVGDYMLGRAYSAIHRTPMDDSTITRLTAAFTRTYERTCRGQALDMNTRADPDLTVGDYLEMVRLKTGDYLALGMVGGAIIAGLSDQEIAPICALGSSMGPAFQIRDDVIDLTRGKGRGGSVGNDIREGKPSILYAHALSEADPRTRQRLIRIMSRGRDETSEEDVQWVISLYRNLGSLEFADNRAEELVAEAFDTIGRIPVRDKSFFQEVAAFMAERAT